MVLTGTTFAGIALPGCLTNYKQSGTRLKPPAAIKNFKSFRKHYPLPLLRSYTFLGTENSIDKPKVHVDGHINSWFRPQELVPWIEKSVKADTFNIELVDGYLPAVKYTYRNPDSKQSCQMTAFAADKDSAGAIHVYVSLLEKAPGEKPAARYLRLKDNVAIDKSQFDTQLNKLRNRWTSFFNQGAPIHCTDPIVNQVCRASIIRSLINYTGKHPRYGRGYYAKPHHDGFPPTTLSMVECLIDWGHIETARDYLVYYFDRFVSDAGKIDYYGPSLAEYGMLLRLVRRLAEVTNNPQWLKHISPKLLAICDWLLKAQADSPNGLIRGVAEADMAHNTEEHDIYFHNNAWVLRGLRAIAPIVYGSDLKDRLNAYHKTILKAVDQFTDNSTAPPFIPPFAKNIKPFRAMTQDRLSNYTNYRLWLELLSSNVLTPRQMKNIVDYRIIYGGEVAGMTAFRFKADNWPIAEYAVGLLHMGKVEKTWDLLYSHMAGHMTTCTWTAYEQVEIVGRPYRRFDADFCVPSQLVAPRVLAWLSNNTRQLL